MPQDDTGTPLNTGTKGLCMDPNSDLARHPWPRGLYNRGRVHKGDTVPVRGGAWGCPGPLDGPWRSVAHSAGPTPSRTGGPLGTATPAVGFLKTTRQQL